MYALVPVVLSVGMASPQPMSRVLVVIPGMNGVSLSKTWPVFSVPGVIKSLPATQLAHLAQVMATGSHAMVPHWILWCAVTPTRREIKKLSGVRSGSPACVDALWQPLLAQNPDVPGPPRAVRQSQPCSVMKVVGSGSGREQSVEPPPPVAPVPLP